MQGRILNACVAFSSFAVASRASPPAALTPGCAAPARLCRAARTRGLLGPPRCALRWPGTTDACRVLSSSSFHPPKQHPEGGGIRTPWPRARLPAGGEGQRPRTRHAGSRGCYAQLLGRRGGLAKQHAMSRNAFVVSATLGHGPVRHPTGGFVPLCASAPRTSARACTTRRGRAPITDRSFHGRAPPVDGSPFLSPPATATGEPGMEHDVGEPQDHSRDGRAGRVGPSADPQ